MHQLAALETEVQQALETFAEKAYSLSDHLAANPEVSEQEFTASRLHVDFLRTCGFTVEYPFAELPTAYSAVLGDGKRPKVALLAEYDALPEIGHACGHNVHGAMTLLAAAGLAPVMNRLNGTLWIVGTPAEETNGAKVSMAARGIFDDTDLAMMIHSGAGKSFVRYRCLAMDAIEFTFKGKAAHAAAMPWEGHNALNGVQLLFHAVDMLRQHVRPEVRMHGIVREGGAAPNIVPESASARFYFRAPWRTYLNELMEKIYNCARGAALATETSVTWRNYEASFDNLKPNPTAESMMEEVFRDLHIPVHSAPEPRGSSDVGNVSFRCPALQPVLALTEEPLALHTREFAALCASSAVHPSILLGAKALALGALRTFLDEELRKSMREDFRSGEERGYPSTSPARTE
jgi:amidohydrolase